MMESEENIDCTIKIVIIGDMSVGKSNLLSRYSKNEFKMGSKPTIGTDFSSKTVEIDNIRIKIQFWDTAGQEKYLSLTSAYYKDAHGIIIVYDITNMNSFRNCEKWLNDVRNNLNGEFSSLLIGNKKDLASKREVKMEEGLKFAQNNQMKFMEVSALSNEQNCVNNAFDILIGEISQKLSISKNSENSKVQLKREKVKKIAEKACC